MEQKTIERRQKKLQKRYLSNFNVYEWHSVHMVPCAWNSPTYGTSRSISIKVDTITVHWNCWLEELYSWYQLSIQWNNPIGNWLLLEEIFDSIVSSVLSLVLSRSLKHQQMAPPIHSEYHKNHIPICFVYFDRLNSLHQQYLYIYRMKISVWQCDANHLCRIMRFVWNPTPKNLFAEDGMCAPSVSL